MTRAGHESIDMNGRVFYVGSLSNTGAWAQAWLRGGTARAVVALRRLRRLMLRHGESNNERALALFLAQGHFESLQRRLGHAYQVRLKLLREALAKSLPTWHIEARRALVPSLWVRLPEA